MKKKILVTTLMVLALGITACSSKKEEPTTAATVATAAETTAAESTEAPEESTEEEEIEEDYMTGLITKIDGTILTVKNDEDETEKNYDISKAEITQEFPFAEGDSVEISYPAETAEDPVPVITLEVLESAISQNTDPSAEGTVTESTADSITLEMEDGNTYTLAASNAYIVGKNGITAGQKATVTYLGDLDDEAMAVKVVMEDSYNTPEAELNAFIGTVAQIEDDHIVLESAEGDFYTFISDDIDFSDYEEDQTLQITYTGSIAAKEIPALDVTEK